MLSGFQSREFGLGLSTLLSEDVLSAVNGLRRGTKYKAEDSAMLVQIIILSFFSIIYSQQPRGHVRKLFPCHFS